MKLCIIYNANREEAEVDIPAGEWNVYVDGQCAGTKPLTTITGGTIYVEPIAALVLGR